MSKQRAGYSESIPFNLTNVHFTIQASTAATAQGKRLDSTSFSPKTHINHMSKQTDRRMKVVMKASCQHAGVGVVHPSSPTRLEENCPTSFSM